MKNKKKLFVIAAIAVALVLIATVSIAIAADADNKGNYNPAANGDTVYLAEETVKKLALNHAGVQEADATNIRITMDYDDGRAEYEVKFNKDNVRYEYEIDAVRGTILSYDAESKKVLQNDTTPAPATATAPATTAAPQNPTYITETAAKEIALQHVGIKEADVTFTKVKLDYDDGKAEYEIDFYTETTKYDYEIDAVNGTILSYDAETRKVATTPKPTVAPATTPTPTKTPQNHTYITQDQAKEIALQHAGLQEADVSRLKIELDYDDGRAEYEVEFQVGYTEYDYEINAVTGNIIYFEKDIDD